MCTGEALGSSTVLRGSSAWLGPGCVLTEAKLRACHLSRVAMFSLLFPSPRLHTAEPQCFCICYPSRLLPLSYTVPSSSPASFNTRPCQPSFGPSSSNTHPTQAPECCLYLLGNPDNVWCARHSGLQSYLTSSVDGPQFMVVRGHRRCISCHWIITVGVSSPFVHWQLR